MKKILASTILMTLAFTVVKSTFAAPNNQNKATNNPNVVAYYEDGLHAIPGNPVTYFEGTNLVMKRGKSGQIQAWYTGEDGHGYHSVWNLKKGSSCETGDVLIEDAYPNWGDYLVPDTDYCVKVNAY